LPAYGRLTEVEFASGLGKATGFGDGLENGQSIPLHPAISAVHGATAIKNEVFRIVANFNLTSRYFHNITNVDIPIFTELGCAIGTEFELAPGDQLSC
jgi:hypothetical protein